MQLTSVVNDMPRLAKRGLIESQSRINESMKQLSSGRKIESAAIDPISIARIASNTSKLRALDAATENIITAENDLTIADLALTTIQDLLVRMKEL